MDTTTPPPKRYRWTRDKRAVCTRLPHGLYAALEELSAALGVSVNQVIVRLLARATGPAELAGIVAEANGNR